MFHPLWKRFELSIPKSQILNTPRWGKVYRSPPPVVKPLIGHSCEYRSTGFFQGLKEELRRSAERPGVAALGAAELGAAAAGAAGNAPAKAQA